MSNRYNIHPALYIGGFAVFFSFIFGFPVGTLMGLAIGIGISKKKWKFVKEFTDEEVTRYTVINKL